MSALAKLRLINEKRTRAISPIIHRRNKLISKIAEQLELASAKKEGRLYAPKKLKFFKDAITGERHTVETTKRVKEWFWLSASGKINFSVRYGSKVIDLAKGKNAVEVASFDELIDALNAVHQAVVDGELDDAISAASEKLRAGFKK